MYLVNLQQQLLANGLICSDLTNIVYSLFSHYVKSTQMCFVYVLVALVKKNLSINLIAISESLLETSFSRETKLLPSGIPV